MPEFGLFGKIPSKGDFVRHNVVDAAARAFEQWVQESNDALRGAGGQLPDKTIRVIFTPPGSDKTIVAVIVPSEDKVGRKFPIVFFALTPAGDTRSHFSTLPFTWAPFLDAGAALGDRAKTMDWDQLRSAIAAVPKPGAIDQRNAAEVCDRTLARLLASELHDRLFGNSGMHYYAYQTFLTACEDASKNDPKKPVTILDCPVKVDVDLFVWLELGKRLFGFPPAHPQIFWVEDPAPRLLLSLGPAAVNVLQLLAKPEAQHNRLWPLTTDREEAVATAQNALGASLGPIDETTLLGDLLDSVSRRGASGSVR